MVVHFKKHEVPYLELSRAPFLVSPLLHFFGGLLQVSSCYPYLVIPIFGKLVGGGGAWSLIAYGKRTRGQQLLSRDNLKWTPARGLALLQVKGELGNIQHLRPTSLVGTHKVLLVELQESIDSLGLSITLWVKTGG